MPNRARNRAWEYYQYSDQVSNNRHNVFVVAESFLIVAFTSRAPNAVKCVVAITGFLWALVWAWVSWRLGRKVKTLDRHLTDPIWREYSSVLKRAPSTPLLLTWFLPIPMAFIWIALVSADVKLRADIGRWLPDMPQWIHLW
jgi:hypothetical protein